MAPQLVQTTVVAGCAPAPLGFSSSVATSETNLLALPEELLHAIAECLDQNSDLNSLSQTCHRLCDIAASILYLGDEDVSIYWAVCRGNVATTRRAMDLGADVADVCNHWRLLHCAVQYGQLDMMQLLLGINGVSLTLFDKRGFIALTIAAAQNWTAATQMLISHGASVSGLDSKGRQPLFAAATTNAMTSPSFSSLTEPKSTPRLLRQGPWLSMPVHRALIER